MKRLCILALACTLACARATAGPQVFLVQNSGWMEPFYADPSSPFKPLVGAVVDAATLPGDPLVLASFNQALPGAPSPHALLAQRRDAATPASVRAVLGALEPAHKPGSTALADTDLGEAVAAALHTALGGKPGLVWVFTNNRNSPDNDQATARRNREFYQLIHQGGAITKAIAFPLRMPVRGRAYRANGLMIYVFAAGEEGARQLDALLASGRIQRVLTEPPARLKPLDRDTVRLAPRQVDEADGVTFSLAADGALIADVEDGARRPAAHVRWQLENAIWPYTIRSAVVGAAARIGGRAQPVTLQHTLVSGLAKGHPQPFDATLALPVANLPSRWSFDAVRTAGSALVLPGEVAVKLGGQQLELDPVFRARMEELFPGDPLPDIFVPPPGIHASTAVLPLQVRVHYGAAPLAALIGAAAALIAGALAAAHAWNRPRRVQLTVDGEARTVLARSGTQHTIYDRAGNEAALLSTSLFGHKLHLLRDDAAVRLGH